MQTLTIHLPDHLNLEEREAQILLATKLYEQGKLSLGQAANWVDLPKVTFMEMLGTYGVSLLNYPTNELERDIQNAKRYSI